jgi:hypothetical protein
MHVFRHFGFAIVTLVGLSLAVMCDSAAAPVKAKGTQPARDRGISYWKALRSVQEEYGIDDGDRWKHWQIEELRQLH